MLEKFEIEWRFGNYLAFISEHAKVICLIYIGQQLSDGCGEKFYHCYFHSGSMGEGANKNILKKSLFYNGMEHSTGSPKPSEGHRMREAVDTQNSSVPNF